MKYLVSGSTGFIGANLCNMLAGQGQILALYHQRPPAQTAYDASIRHIHFDELGLLHTQAPLDMLIHCAALHPNSADAPLTPKKYFDVNCEITRRVAETAQRLQARYFIYLSTISVYGDVDADCLDEETSFINPGVYGTTKYLGEMIARDSCGAATCLSLRLPGVIGGAARHAWLCDVKRRALQNAPIVIYNPYARFNNITDVHDIARLVEHVSRRSGVESDVFNIATSQPLTVMDAVQTVIKLTGSRSVIELANDVRHSFCISTEKLSKKLGFTPTTTQDSLVRYSLE